MIGSGLSWGEVKTGVDAGISRDISNRAPRSTPNYPVKTRLWHPRLALCIAPAQAGTQTAGKSAHTEPRIRRQNSPTQDTRSLGCAPHLRRLSTYPTPSAPAAPPGTPSARSPQTARASSDANDTPVQSQRVHASGKRRGTFGQPPAFVFIGFRNQTCRTMMSGTIGIWSRRELPTW